MKLHVNPLKHKTLVSPS